MGIHRQYMARRFDYVSAVLKAIAHNLNHHHLLTLWKDEACRIGNATFPVLFDHGAALVWVDGVGISREVVALIRCDVDIILCVL
jgi:hypothetical protein